LGITHQFPTIMLLSIEGVLLRRDHNRVLIGRWVASNIEQVQQNFENLYTLSAFNQQWSVIPSFSNAVVTLVSDTDVRLQTLLPTLFLIAGTCRRHVYTRSAYKTIPHHFSRFSSPMTPSSSASSSSSNSKQTTPTRFLKSHLSTMKLFALALGALTSFAAAQDYNITSSGFRLFLKSDNATLDGYVRPLSVPNPMLTHPQHRPRRLPPRRSNRRSLHHHRAALVPHHRRLNLLPQRLLV
jgi:hypothetical protein